MIDLFSFSLSHADVWVVAAVAVCIGMSKTGIHGAGMIAVPLLASVFGGQKSSGVMLPILCIADVMGVWYYHRHASWAHLRKLFPWAAAGTLLGTVVGGSIDDHQFKIVMAVIIVASVIIMIWLEKDRKKNVPDVYWFAALTGVAGGFTSMIGNLAGSVMAIYFLSMRLPKNSFIGTTAWFFMTINWFKIPFHIWVWESLDTDTFLLGIVTVPLIGLGAWLGILIVRRLPEVAYRWFVILMTLVAASFMFL